jgi:ribonuclease PH
LVYVEDSKARVDLNLVATGQKAIVEVQGTAEGEAVPRSDLDAMINLALSGVASLVCIQREVIAAAKVDLASLFMPGRWTA